MRNLRFMSSLFFMLLLVIFNASHVLAADSYPSDSNHYNLNSSGNAAVTNYDSDEENAVNPAAIDNAPFIDNLDFTLQSYDVEQWQWTDAGVKQERCTYRVWHEAYDRLGISLPVNWGNAATWASSARSQGKYTVDNTPSVNSIVCWGGGRDGWGHVAYVTGVDNRNVYIREAGIDPVNGVYYQDTSYLISNQNRWNGYWLEGYIHLDYEKHPGSSIVPVSADFIPKNGFQAEGYIGQKVFNCDLDLYGTGNTIAVHFSDGSIRNFICRNDDEADGYLFSEEDRDLTIVGDPLTLDTGLEKGHNVVTYKVRLYHETDEVEYDPVDLSVDCVANKYNAYMVERNYTYTGKKITIKPVVKNSVGETVPKAAYTCSYTKHKKMGYYEVRIYFKNTNIYPRSILGNYSIGPKNPTISVIKSGSKSATIYLKKISKENLRNIARYEMIITSDKEWFDSNEFDYEDLIHIKKNKTKITVRHLKKGKTYYVKICSYKNGVYSEWSKTKKIRIR